MTDRTLEDIQPVWMAELTATILARMDELLAPIKADISTIKDDIGAIKTDLDGIKNNVQAIRVDIEQIKTEAHNIEKKQGLTQRLAAIVRDPQIYSSCFSIDVCY